MKTSFTTFVSLLTLICTSPAEAQTEEETLARILESARHTESVLEEKSVTWTTSIELQGGASRATVTRVQHPQMRFISVSVTTQHQTVELAKIIERNGLWYVIELDKRYICRPYEAPLALPSTYHLIELSELLVVDSIAKSSQFGELESIDGDTASFRTPLPPQLQAQLRALLPILSETLQSESVF